MIVSEIGALYLLLSHFSVNKNIIYTSQDYTDSNVLINKHMLQWVSKVWQYEATAVFSYDLFVQNEKTKLCIAPFIPDISHQPCFCYIFLQHNVVILHEHMLCIITKSMFSQTSRQHQAHLSCMQMTVDINTRFKVYTIAVMALEHCAHRMEK